MGALYSQGLRFCLILWLASIMIRPDCLSEIDGEIGS